MDPSSLVSEGYYIPRNGFPITAARHSIIQQSYDARVTPQKQAKVIVHHPTVLMSKQFVQHHRTKAVILATTKQDQFSIITNNVTPQKQTKL